MRRISFGRACSYCCRSGGIRPMVRARGPPRFHPLCSKGGAQSSTRRRPPARELVGRPPRRRPRRKARPRPTAAVPARGRGRHPRLWSTSRPRPIPLTKLPTGTPKASTSCGSSRPSASLPAGPDGRSTPPRPRATSSDPRASPSSTQSSCAVTCSHRACRPRRRSLRGRRDPLPPHSNPAAEAASLLAPEAQAAVPLTVELGVARVHALRYGPRATGATGWCSAPSTPASTTPTRAQREVPGNLGGGNYEHNYNWWMPARTPRQNVPYDDDSHGTHTTGTVLGDDGDPGTNQIGVALTQSGSPPRSSPTAAPRATKRLPKPKTSCSRPGTSTSRTAILQAPPRDQQLLGRPRSAGTPIAGSSPRHGSTRDLPGLLQRELRPAAGSVGSPGAYPFLIGTGAINAATDTIAGLRAAARPAGAVVSSPTL